jgi:hypothetical protein
MPMPLSSIFTETYKASMPPPIAAFASKPRHSEDADSYPAISIFAAALPSVDT